MRFGSSLRVCGVATLALGLFTIVPATAQAQKTDFALKDGDRVVFYGDSITDQRQYTVFTEDFVLTRFPKRKISFVHSGWGGDRVSGGGGGSAEVRVARDIVPYRPTVVTIMLGMNDASYRPFDSAIFKNYATGYRRLLDLITGPLPKARVTLIQPSPFDDVTRAPGFPEGYNSVLVRYGNYLKEEAATRQMGIADLNTDVVAMLTKAKATDAKLSQEIIPDRVHPGAAGHLIMAGALLKAWNAPSIVSRVAISGGDSVRVTKIEQAKIKDLKRKSDNSLSWNVKEDALPFPLNLQDKTLQLAVNSSDFVAALNQEILQVTDLSAPRYTLQIDTMKIGEFTREELAAGINLATLPTPMLMQSLKVHELTRQHNEIHFQRWRAFQVPMENKVSPSAMKKALEGLDALEEDLVRQQREAAQPQERQFTLTPAA
jgi:lysophospholipase L1-like esterase